MKKLAICSIIMLLLIILAPCINATILTEKQSNESGRIHGSVYEASFHESSPVVLAKLVLEAEGIQKTTYTGLLGGFEFKNLPVGLTYTITASHPLYHTKVYTYTLTPDKPDLEVAMNLYRKVDHSKERITNEESSGYGRVSGFVHTAGFPPYTEISGAKIVLEGDFIKRITYSGFLGGYRFNFVEIGKLYTLTASHPKYETETKTFTISANNPHIFINFPMYIKENIKTKNEKPANLGSIWGNTGEWYIWGFSPVGLVKVEAGGKSTVSSPIMGFYKIRNLPLGTYTITGTKLGYDTFTDTVKLTEQHPDKQVFVHMEPIDKSVNKARVQNENVETKEKTTEKNTINNNGKISGDVVTPRFSLFVGVPGIKMACGKNYNEYVTTFTDDGGEFEFTDLPYEDSGTVYRVFMLKTPGIIHVLQKKRVTLDSENPEVKIRFILPFVIYNRETKNRPLTLGR